jgi:hypothetical protein
MRDNWQGQVVLETGTGGNASMKFLKFPILSVFGSQFPQEKTDED